DNRNNMIMGIVLNALLLWDYKYMLKLEKWRSSNSENFDNWIKVISEFDAFSSLANFAYNNRQFVFPDVHQKEFKLEMKDAGHPLIPDNMRINNDLVVNGKSNFFIITGANMAGKSTFLRTVGVNLVMAMAGAPVCASRFVFKPVDVFTGMRTSDSLQKNESYFFAELSRLKTLIDLLRKGKEMFVILDEVLKGTNSKDKRLGSLALLRQLVGMEATGIIATHDVSLGDLEKEFPNNVSNRRFEVEIENDELIFDYKLKTGISRNLNATFLMKKMGITI
ncbi:MAG: DNA mismatch repair protein MutS, partial [Bacteroidota bacterium]|nr:DNA mismatch repair protein MutS [Bacteroidota bacterium]